MEGSGFDDFNIDKQEYQSVFKVFDKNNTGEIGISQVYELINKFDQASKIGEQPVAGIKTAATMGAKNPGGISGSSEVSPNIGGGNVRQQTIGGISTKISAPRGGGAANAVANATKNNISPSTKKAGVNQGNQGAFGPGGGGLQLKPTSIDPSKSPRVIGISDKPGGGLISKQQSGISGGLLQQQPAQQQQKEVAGGGTQLPFEDFNFGNLPLIQQSEDKKQAELTFPNGKTSLKFEDFFNIVKESCADKEQAENYLIHAFSMFDRKKKGYINNEDLKEVFKLLGESVTDDEVNTMIKIAGVKSNDKINFREFVDFFNKVD